MVSVKTLNDSFKVMVDNHKSGEGAQYETIRENLETFNNETEDVKEKINTIKSRLKDYTSKSGKIEGILNNLRKKALEVPTCKMKITESKNALKTKHEQLRQYISQYVKKVGTQSDLGGVAGDLSSLMEKLEEEPHKELEQQVKDLETHLKLFLKMKPHCLNEKIASALEQIIFLEGINASITPEKLITYVPQLKEKEVKTALQKLSEENCGVKLQYTFDIKVIDEMSDR